MAEIPTKARAVVIGGGVVGCSVAYHLAKLGWTDVVLLERKQLTCGTTWHAAGLIGQLRATANMTKLAKYTQELYFGALEEETGDRDRLQAAVARSRVALNGGAQGGAFPTGRYGSRLWRRCRPRSRLRRGQVGATNT